MSTKGRLDIRNVHYYNMFYAQLHQKGRKPFYAIKGKWVMSIRNQSIYGNYILQANP